MARNCCLLLLAAQNLQPVCQPKELAFFGGATVTIEQLVAELLASKRSANRREVYLKSLAHYFGRFIKGREKHFVGSFTTAHVEAWLQDFQDDYSRQTWLNRISTLFSFAVRREYIIKNPCAKIERVTIEHKTPQVLTVSQSRALLQACPTVCKPWLVLAMFAGIRPDGELMKVQWEDVNLDTETVRIQFPKVRKHKRIVPLPKIAADLLREHPLRSGPIAPSASTVRRFKRRMRKVVGWEKWPQDVLRHTAASYLMALHKDAGKVAAMLGNSVGILMTHYHDPVTAEACAQFWTK